MKRYRAKNPDYVKRERTRAKEYNSRNRDKCIEYAIKRQAERKAFINTFKDAPCMDCGNSFPPYVMDFDHVGGDKIQNVGEMGSYSVESILKEIAKCDLVCANCHRIRTHKRQQHS